MRRFAGKREAGRGQGQTTGDKGPGIGAEGRRWSVVSDQWSERKEIRLTEISEG